MDTLEFVSKLVEALAWPISAIVIVVLFKRSIIQKIPGLKSLKLPGGIEADFLLKTVEYLETKVVRPEAEGDEPNNSPQPLETPVLQSPVSTEANLPTPSLPTPPHPPMAAPSARPSLHQVPTTDSAPQGTAVTPWAMSVVHAAEKLESTLRQISDKLYPHVLFSGRYGHVALQRFIDLTDFLTESEKLAMRKLIGIHRDEIFKLAPDEAAGIIENFEKMELIFRARAEGMLAERASPGR